jgi:uncharacterized tellurite resistance protein B-like protein
MFQALRNLIADLSDANTTRAFDANDDRLAVAALLVHAAAIDGSFSDDERRVLTERLKSKFDLDDDTAATLIEQAVAADREAVDLYRFTSLLLRELDEDGRRRIVGLMWEIVYADGKITEFEDNLIWRAADLLHVPSQARIALRQRVAESAINGSRQEPRHD